MVKTGERHLDSLRDGRNVFLDGELITDVVDHPAYRNAVRSAAALYDFQAAPENLELMTFESPTNGERVNRCCSSPGPTGSWWRGAGPWRLGPNAPTGSWAVRRTT